MGPLIAIAIRLIVPVFILRWPLGGIIAGIVADTLDVVIVAAVRSQTFEDYVLTDKLLDAYMLGFAAFVSLRWDNRIAKLTSIVLFFYRIVGVLVLEATGARWVLFIFPNVFDFFFIYHLTTVKWLPHLEVNGYRRLALVMSILLSMKLFQEYILHVAELRPGCWLSAHIFGTVRPFFSMLMSKYLDFAREILNSSGIQVKEAAGGHSTPVSVLVWDAFKTHIWLPAQQGWHGILQEIHGWDAFKTHVWPVAEQAWHSVLQDVVQVRPYEKQCLRPG